MRHPHFTSSRHIGAYCIRHADLTPDRASYDDLVKYYLLCPNVNHEDVVESNNLDLLQAIVETGGVLVDVYLFYVIAHAVRRGNAKMLRFALSQYKNYDEGYFSVPDRRMLKDAIRGEHRDVIEALKCEVEATQLATS